MSELSPDRLQRVRELFDLVVEAPPAERAAVLAAAAGRDATLMAEVQSLVEAHAAASDEWERSPMDRLRANAPWGDAPCAPGTRLGPWVITRLVGTGGMGAVYEAQRADAAYEGRVAIKTLASGARAASIARRFLRERQILARLQHPNIATLLDGGTTAEGLPYLVMEYVEGESIDQHCDARRLPIAQRLDLFRQACGAIQYAHRNLVVHRDLKPGNILVTGDGVVKLLDFGIAKLQTPNADSEDGATRDGMVPLTTAYASPEQARGEEVTTASDVYSAGVVLYRLLAGRLPHETASGSAAAIRERLSSELPPLPSLVATEAHAHACGMGSAATLRRGLGGELDAIVMMALRKEPERRYASAAALADDILRFLRGHPVAARPDTWSYRFSSFVRRQRALVGAGAIACTSLVIGTGIAVQQARLARAEAARATRINDYLRAIVGAADPIHFSSVRTGRRDVGLLEVLDSTRAKIGRDLGREPRIRADLYWSMGNAYRAFGRYDVALALLDSAATMHAATAGDGSPDVARDVHFKGVVYQDMGELVDAERQFRAAYDLYARLPAPPDSERTDIATSLGQLLGVGLNRPAEGEVLLREAERRLAAEPHNRVAMTGLVYGALATTLIALGRLDAADSSFARGIAAYDTDSLKMRYERSILLANWGFLKATRGEASAAVALRRRAVNDTRASMGEGLQVVRLQQRLNDDQLRLKAWDAAWATADSALAALDTLGSDEPLERAALERQKAQVSLARRDLAGAARWLDQADRSLARVTHNGRFTVAPRLLVTRGELHEARGDLVAAERLHREAVTIATTRAGPTTPVARIAFGYLAAYQRRHGSAQAVALVVADSAQQTTPKPR